MSSVEFYSVPKEVVWRVWKSILPLIEKSIEYSHGKASLDDLLESLLKEESQLFIAVVEKIRFAWITEIQQYRDVKILLITFAGGEESIGFLKDVFSFMERWGRELECDAIEIQGRPGWERLLGMERISVTLRKKLEKNK